MDSMDSSMESALPTGFGLLSINVQTGLIVVIVFLVGIMVIQYLRAPPNLPPGPYGVPVLGVLPRLARSPAYLTIQRWWEKYGDVYSCYMGSRLVVIINGVDAMRECFVKQGDTFNARPWNYFKKLTKNKGTNFFFPFRRLLMYEILKNNVHVFPNQCRRYHSPLVFGYLTD